MRQKSVKPSYINRKLLLESLDSKDWAHEFMKLYPDVNESTIIAWFAHAIARAYIAGHKEGSAPYYQDIL